MCVCVCVFLPVRYIYVCTATTCTFGKYAAACVSTLQYVCMHACLYVCMYVIVCACVYIHVTHIRWGRCPFPIIRLITHMLISNP